MGYVPLSAPREKEYQRELALTMCEEILAEPSWWLLYEEGGPEAVLALAALPVVAPEFEAVER